MALYDKVGALSQALEKIIVGQHKLVQRLLLALFADGHLLVEGAPGLAKTKSIKALSQLIEADFHRIQFTPDLLPADITGTEMYQTEVRKFSFQPGPVFHNLILADEINRAAAKVQSALLEAMEERQVSIGNVTHKLPKLFLVMATQNPIEQEGTYSLPEAQLDRFMMHVKISYPDIATEKTILRLNREEHLLKETQNRHQQTLLSQDDIFSVRRAIMNVHMDASIEEYIVQLIMATRTPEKYCEKLGPLIEYGASPRASIFLDRASRAMAWLRNRDFVALSDVTDILHEVLRHRIGLTFEAQSLGYTTDRVIDEIRDAVALP
ncbi:MAG TPA: AAA family ATPase [Myxococcota bacterium]|nr:AAA family ATPase [Myxococcota bacterium]